MAQPALSTSLPANNATDVFLNKPLVLTFSAALLSSSVTQQSIVLINSATNEVVDRNVVYDSDDYTVTITPFSLLEENSVYVVRVVGIDIALSTSTGYVVADSGGEQLTTTITITFTTGTRVYIDDTSIDKDALNLSLEGDLNLPVHIKALGEFVVSTTTPKNYASDVSTTLDGFNRVQIKFNKPISGDLLEDDWLVADIYPLLDVNAYIASGEVLGSGTLPTMSGIEYSGNYLYAMFDGEVPNNVGIHITISETVTATDGSEFGPSEYALQFSTDRYPKVSGIHYMRREIKAASDELHDDYIAALLFKNTIKHMARYSSFSAGAPSLLSIKWITAATIVDILDDQELQKALVAGTRRQLGDLNVSIDAIIGKLSLKHARALKDMEDAEKGLLGAGAIGAQISQLKASLYPDVPSRLWYGINGKVVDSRFKYYQPDLPAANISEARQGKVQPNQYWW